MQTGTYLDKIIANTLIEVAVSQRDTPPLALPGTPTRDFAGALRGDTVRLIAEVKHASPSKGVLIEPFDPVAIARDYAAGGAAALSVLTDRAFFKGSLADLVAVRAAVDLPIIRKDFVIDPFQLVEARAAGADAALLIVGILDDGLLREMYALAQSLGLAALVEVHDAEEMERAARLNPTLIGINNRDLRTFKTDLQTTVRLAKLAPPGVTLVAESGIFTADHVRMMADAGAHAILVGESLITAADRAAQLGALTTVQRAMHGDKQG
jgi:indole-3-glycerol phosphate synthase